MAKMNTNLDDWETDPDFVREMDEMDQRWGNKRTVGSINMNELIDEVKRDHKTIREKNHHSSQRNYSSNLETDPRPPVSTGYESEKKISRKIITESSERYVKDTFSSRDTAAKETKERIIPIHKPNPTISPKPNLADVASNLSSAAGRYSSSSTTSKPERTTANKGPYDNVKTDPPKQFKESSVSKQIFMEEKSSSSSRDNVSSPKSPSTGASASGAFKSIQDKIDAFKKEFENIESKVAKKSDMSKVIKKSTNIEKFDNNVKYVSREPDGVEKTTTSYKRATTTSPNNNSSGPASSNRPSSASPSHGSSKTGMPSGIKSLSEKFETLGRETSEEFRRRMEERRKEFFDEIKSQVRATRKGLDGFDMIDSDEEDDMARFRKQHSRSQEDNSCRSTTSVTKPKVYTKRETTQEKIVSTFVKENDKVIHDETKRNVERTSSCHGSSDEEADIEPTSIKHISREHKTSPPPTSSPIDELKRKMPFVEPTNKGSGLMARTLYDYQAAEDDELSFDVDDLITNIEKLDKGWYKGTIVRNGRKQVGLFPANYVKLLNDSSFY
jgi:hypothetical protein